jgi:hypothetical protein
MLRPVVLPFVILAAFASTLVAKESKCDVALHYIDTLLEAYGKEHPLKQYPSTLKEFQNFAAKKGQPLDLSVFSDFRFDRHGTSLDILYTCKATGESGVAGHFTVTAY